MNVAFDDSDLKYFYFNCGYLAIGISSYGVSMTTLEEVFLHLEKDEENDCTMDNLSKKMVRNRALSRSLSLQSKSTSYQSLQNEGNTNYTEKDGNIFVNIFDTWFFFKGNVEIFVV